MDHLSTQQRVVIGKEWEDRVRNDLNTKYGYNLKESTFHEDCREKTDCWFIPKSGTPLRSAIKVRLNKYGLLEKEKTDILASLFDPFYGVDHVDTKKGRDMIVDYHLYISVIYGKHRVADGRVIHNICESMYQEGLERIKAVKPEPRGYKPKILFSSVKYPGCQIWLHYDAKTRIPKLLGFVNPKILKLGKEIKEHDFICDEE
jgi:hypothetical protein